MSEPPPARAPSARVTVKRKPQRGTYDRTTIDEILDEGLICHVGFSAEGETFVLPMIHVRVGDKVYLHGSPASRTLQALADGAEACLAVTIVDGLVLARSAMHHSMNYRSVVLIGAATVVEDAKEKLTALHALTEHVIPGRWNDTRWPTEAELRQTLVLAIPIDEASAKIRTGPPLDDEADYGLPYWAGVIPLRLAASKPIPDPRLPAGIDPPAYVSGAGRWSEGSTGETPVRPDVSTEERQLLEVLDSMLREESVRAKIEPIALSVERKLIRDADAVMAWQPIPLAVYGNTIPADIRSSWVFILRSGATMGAERHPNSHQRMMSYRGCGDLQIIVDGNWTSNELVSDRKAPLLARWASIPVNVWHQAVVPRENWVIVSFHTAEAQELIEERPDGDVTRQRLYLGNEDG